MKSKFKLAKLKTHALSYFNKIKTKVRSLPKSIIIFIILFTSLITLATASVTTLFVIEKLGYITINNSRSNGLKHDNLDLVNETIESTSLPSLVPTPTPTSTPTSVPITYISAFGSYVHMNEEEIINIKFPLNGGSISGSVSGKCNLVVSGSYNKQKNEILGSTVGKCHTGDWSFENTGDLVNAVAKGTFIGKIDMTIKKIELDFEGGLYPYSPYDNTTRHIPLNNGHTTLTIK